jgi:hypothetical protein
MQAISDIQMRKPAKRAGFLSEHLQSITMIGSVQGIKIHLADACLLSDVRDCSAGTDSLFSLTTLRRLHYLS